MLSHFVFHPPGVGIWVVSNLGRLRQTLNEHLTILQKIPFSRILGRCLGMEMLGHRVSVHTPL